MEVTHLYGIGASSNFVRERFERSIKRGGKRHRVGRQVNRIKFARPIENLAVTPLVRLP